MSVFEKDNKHKVRIPSLIKEFVIERIKKGEAPKRITFNVKRQFDFDISFMAVGRIRKDYIELTGEYLKSYQEFHNLKPYGVKK